MSGFGQPRNPSEYTAEELAEVRSTAKLAGTRQDMNQPLRRPPDKVRHLTVTDLDHPYGGDWWPPGHGLGWEASLVHELHHLLNAIATDRSVAPLGATFDDGYRCAVVCDAILESARTGRRVAL